jgi:ribosome-associated heat shock protein Hsp15
MLPNKQRRLSEPITLYDNPMAPAERDCQRIDKWLWHARLVRTRSAAAALANSGYVRVNGARVRASSRMVHQGDVITVALDRNVRVVRIRAFAKRRGAVAGQKLYEEVELNTPPRR